MTPTPALPMPLAYGLPLLLILLAGLTTYAVLATRKQRRLERDHEQQLSQHL